MKQSLILQASSILHIPLDKYDKEFTFIVNGQLFQTSRLVADLLSTKISRYHLTDPTVNEITINTKTKGNFQLFLNLQQFNEEKLSFSDFIFLKEIINQLGTEVKEIQDEITLDNVIGHIRNHSNYRSLFSDQFDEEISFISKNFSKINKSYHDLLLNLPLDVLEISIQFCMSTFIFQMLKIAL